VNLSFHKESKSRAVSSHQFQLAESIAFKLQNCFNGLIPILSILTVT